MIEKPKLVNTTQQKSCTKLHSDAISILFEHRRQLRNLFLQISGLHDLTHFAIKIINPVNEIVVFSSTPHIEYNLIKQEFWSYDPYFSQKPEANTLFFWDELANDHFFAEEIKQVRLGANDFTIGMTISRAIDDFCFLYSFATNSKRQDLREYYQSQIFSLIDIGDYLCKSILNLYSEYRGNYAMPRLTHLSSKVSEFNVRPSLKLVINKP